MTDSDKNSINVTDSDVQAVHFRPVSFIPHDPEVWFAALELQFETRRITSQRQKYAFALKSLPGDHLVAVREVVLNSNVPNVYDRLKEAILRHFLPSREERLRTLLAHHPQGDAKPSHHLTRLQSLAGPLASDSEIVKELWLESLPAHIQPTVTALLEDAPLNHVALIADKILARTSSRDSYVVASTARPKVDMDVGHSSAHGDTRLSFRDRCNVPQPYVPRARSSSCKPVTTRPKRASSNPRRKAASEASESWCWFHRSFGSGVRHC
ncbi:unnamed protein product [Schistosoma curassoni]|uniref:DUF7041 domain-containing protein n=1 Tax=Schistosoma curassoni TaxID=6186 RepID=A0A183JKF6_9TREM|nr:unnamed protein product [Schistosoma curassoni]